MKFDKKLYQRVLYLCGASREVSVFREFTFVFLPFFYMINGISKNCICVLRYPNGYLLEVCHLKVLY